MSPVTREVTVMLRESSLIDSVPCMLELVQSQKEFGKLSCLHSAAFG